MSPAAPRTGPGTYLPVGKAAEFLHMHRDTIRRWADRGTLPSVRSPTGRRLFHIADLEQFKAEHSRKEPVA